LRQIRNTSERARQAELTRDMHHALLVALGYSWRRDVVLTALEGNLLVPVIGRVADAEGRDALWAFEAPITNIADEADDPLSACFMREQFSEDAIENAVLDRPIEELLADGVFELADGPRYVLILGLSQIVLVDKRKWPARSVLRFDLQEIFTRADRSTLVVMACLISREARVPEQGVPISDRLEEEAQRNANAVTTSLKKTVRDAIEILGQEVLSVTGGKYPSNFVDRSRRDIWIDGPELSLECLRYMYRLLFLFYAEANPRLNILDLKNPVYASGYSMEALRELESVPLRTPADRAGTYLWDSLQRTFGLLYTGESEILRLPAVKVALLDPDSTPLLNALRLRNEAVQNVIRLLSLRSNSKSTGRISYAKLGIGQLGAVYETLISFTGVVAKTDLIELKPRKSRSEDADTDDESADETEDTGEEDADAVEEEPEPEENDEVFRRDKVDTLAASWFVPRSRLNEFKQEEIVFDGPEARIYPKGSFIYRLAGRDREKSASYYTPEPLARLLVKHALMERCKELSADELLELKILEPAMGSAAFLVETTNQLADLYLERKQKETGRTIPQDRVVIEKQKVRAYIADRNCFGVDLNPVAIELGAISLWLNSLHANDVSPWFGDQLHAGNSLIGARRASYPPSLLTAKKQADLWFNAKPEEIGWRKQLPEDHVWQWLLPAKGMANFDKDKSITPFASDAQERIKEWRRNGFVKKLEPHEAKLVQKLSRIAEVLFQQVADDLARTRVAANDEITVWPDKVMPGNQRMDFYAKEQLKARLTGSDHAANTLPYKRLKTAMDAWCALWLWPLDRAHLLPSRAEFLQGMAMILEGGFTVDGSLAAPSVKEFADPAPDFLDLLEPDAPARDLFTAAAKRQKELFRETNVEALIETFDWLGVAVEVAERERFVHFDLIFADVMKARGGFDVIVGNPPWAKPSWNEGLVLADIDPLYAGLSASDVKKILPGALAKAKSEKRFLQEFVSIRGAMEVVSSEIMNPFAGGGTNNLYACFLDLAFRLQATHGYVGMLHEDVYLSSGGLSTFRENVFRRLVKSFHFRNELKSKMFSEIGNKREYSANVYGPRKTTINFKYAYGLFHPSQVDDCFSHDGIGPIPTQKYKNGQWDTRGHAKRLVTVDAGYLADTARLFGVDQEKATMSGLVRFYAEPIKSAVVDIARAKELAELPEFLFSNMYTEETVGDSVLKLGPHFPQFDDDVVLASPHISIGNVCFQAANRRSKTHRDFDLIDLLTVPAFFRPRCKYMPPVMGPNEAINAYLPFYKLGIRRRVDVSGERMLIAAIIPPGWAHIETISSVHFNTYEALLDSSAVAFSIISDFVTRVIGQTTLRRTAFEVLPFVKMPKAARRRVLELSCVTNAFKDIWNTEITNLKPVSWSSYDRRLISENSTSSISSWTEDSFLKSEFSRRMALIENDVLVSQTIGLSLEQLLDIYEIYYPVMQQYEAGTWYDQHGRIVWTCSKGLPGVGWLDERGKSPGRSAWERVLAENHSELNCTAVDDTQPGGPREIIRHFVGPFTQCDRIEDYRRAWAHFERLKYKDVA
jgi:hypothetical protein